MTFEIIYNYEDEMNIRDITVVDTWDELQEEIKEMKQQGCYNITAACIGGEMSL